ncbi:MAG: flagellar hook-length control protein FliK [Peptostreptococcaceae bacterium]|nr:flagellar hook-length control protein FliK [Peptostreptococcaceae bacterium]
MENARSLANLILPRMETKKVSRVQEGFKGALERGREKAEEDRDFASVDKRPKKEAFAKDRARDQREKQIGKKIGKPWERPRSERASEQKERISDEKTGLQADLKEQPIKEREVKRSLSAEEANEKIGEGINEGTNNEGSPISERVVQDLRDAASLGQIPPQNTTLPESEVSAGETLKESAIPVITKEFAAGKDQIKGESLPEIDHGFSEETVRESLLSPFEETSEEGFPGEGLAEKGAVLPKAERDVQMEDGRFLQDRGLYEAYESRNISQLPSGSIQEEIRNLMRTGEAENLQESSFSFSEEDERDRGSLFVLPDARVRVSISPSALHPAKTLGADRSEFSFAAKVLDEVRISLGQNKNEMKIQLHPQTLGKLTVKLSSENGVMNASFFAENDKAKQMIESQMEELRRTLETQGIQVQNLSVTVDSGKEELSRHKNIMEAKKYSRLSSAERQTDIMEVFAELQNPYVLEDEFSEMV